MARDFHRRGPVVAACRIGFQTGLVRLHNTSDEARKGQIGTLQGAVLGLLALLLGFTFAMAVQRYDNRRDLVVADGFLPSYPANLDHSGNLHFG